MNISATVSAELGLRLVSAEQTVVPLVASLHYSASDPYAIRMAFHVGPEEPVEWIFARELLADGMATPVGDGDVQIWPSSSAMGADGEIRGPLSVLNLKLSSPFGEAHFEAPADAISNFLDRTYGIVRMGRETDVIDIDAELNGLLWQA
jgi:Streptomyces sporulation and cell division protein, SsgA